MTNNTADSPAVHQESASAAAYINKGWELKSSGKLDEAEDSFRKAITLQPGSVEAYYALGLTLKAQNRRQESIRSFEKVFDLVEGGLEDRVRGQMLRRLTLGHINQLSNGDWNLEHEIWQRK